MHVIASLMPRPCSLHVVVGMGQEDARVAQDFIGRDMLLHAFVLLEHPFDLQPSARPRQLAPVARRHNSYAFQLRQGWNYNVAESVKGGLESRGLGQAQRTLLAHGRVRWYWRICYKNWMLQNSIFLDICTGNGNWSCNVFHS
jgi:hypothetical protein